MPFSQPTGPAVRHFQFLTIHRIHSLHWANTLTITLSLIFADAYTIRAVGQEEFSDVKVPDEPAQSKSQKN